MRIFSLLWRHGIAAVLFGAMLVLAGCASPSLPTPAPTGLPVPLPTPVRPLPVERDGVPPDPPANLAQQADPEPVVEPIRAGGPNKPYVVLGQAYEPQAEDKAFKDRGLASWYGRKFHGRRTASGELFNAYGLSAAHRTWPIPSYARVRNVATGKEIIVRINDRGPFHSQRLIDLSYGAAVKLGILSTAEVDIERLTFDDIRSGAWRRGDVPPANLTDPASDPLMSLALRASSKPSEVLPAASNESPAASSADGGAAAPLSKASTPAAQGYWVQLAALGRREGVERLQQQVATDLQDVSPMLAVFHEAPLFKLQLGPYASRSEAQLAAQRVGQTLQLKPLVLERR